MTAQRLLLGRLRVLGLGYLLVFVIVIAGELRKTAGQMSPARRSSCRAGIHGVVMRGLESVSLTISKVAGRGCFLAT